MAREAAALGNRGVFTWDGNSYALNLTERLDLEGSGGLLRIGLVHYNSAGDVRKVLAELNRILNGKGSR